MGKPDEGLIGHRTGTVKGAGTQGARHPGVQKNQVSARATHIPGAKLRRFGTDEQNSFMLKVYRLHWRSGRGAARKEGRGFVQNLPASDLAVVEGEERAKKGAAVACRQLLIAAREELATQKANGVRKARGVRNIGVASGYRSAGRQFKLWRDRFPAYYKATKEERAKLPGGEHGEAAAKHLRSYIAGRTASPGYSRHNAGTAIDFSTVDGGKSLGPSKKHNSSWKTSWFYGWLKEHAESYGFFQNPHIYELWHWEFKSQTEVLDFLEPDYIYARPDPLTLGSCEIAAENDCARAR